MRFDDVSNMDPGSRLAERVSGSERRVTLTLLLILVTRVSSGYGQTGHNPGEWTVI